MRIDCWFWSSLVLLKMYRSRIVQLSTVQNFEISTATGIFATRELKLRLKVQKFNAKKSWLRFLRFTLGTNRAVLSPSLFLTDLWTLFGKFLRSPTQNEGKMASQSGWQTFCSSLFSGCLYFPNYQLPMNHPRRWHDTSDFNWMFPHSSKKGVPHWTRNNPCVTGKSFKSKLYSRKEQWISQHQLCYVMRFFLFSTVVSHKWKLVITRLSGQVNVQTWFQEDLVKSVEASLRSTDNCRLFRLLNQPSSRKMRSQLHNK